MNNNKIAFHTLGCRLNQFETESLATQFINNGYEVVDFNDEADIYILNTCTVTGKSDRKSRNLINRMLSKNAITVVTGCFAESANDYLEKTDIDLVIGNLQKQNIFSIVDSYIKKHVVPNTESGIFDFPPASSVFHTRGTVKIHDGCNNFCSFCIIPYVRGRAVSLDPEKVLDNVRKTIQKGYKEISLTGVNISRYKYEQTDFTALLAEILKIDENFRLRISSIEPENLSDDFIALFDNPKMCHHLHLCLQSGSEEILEKMKRKYTFASFYEFTKKLRSRYPLFNLTTDIMTGFPQESEQNFRETLEAIRLVNFGHVHTFPYSRRSGTLADKMTGHISEQIKKLRAADIRLEAEKQKTIYRKKLVGIRETVLTESVSDAFYGYGNHYVPVSFNGKECQVNDFYQVKITGLNDDLCLSADLL